MLLCCLPLVLTQCVDPYGNPMSPFGTPNPRPYDDGREQYRNDMRDQDRAQSQQAYERGMRDGTEDARSGRPMNQRNPYAYAPDQGRAYTEGYDQGYRSVPQRGPGYGAPNYGGEPNYGSQPEYGGSPGYPGSGGGYIPPVPPSEQPASPGSNDPVYSQGYDYGVRDRAAGRAADVDAHNGRYDPRNRRSFEQGYYDAFDSRR